MQKPKWLYEALPWIYAAAGALVMLALRNWMAVLSGGMLMVTGALVWVMRRRFRRRVHDGMYDDERAYQRATLAARRQPAPGDIARQASVRAQARARATTGAKAKIGTDAKTRAPNDEKINA